MARKKHSGQSNYHRTTTMVGNEADGSKSGPSDSPEIIAMNPATKRRSSSIHYAAPPIPKKRKSPCVGCLKCIFILVMLTVLILGSIYLTFGLLLRFIGDLYKDDNAARFISIGLTWMGAMLLTMGIVGMISGYTESKITSVAFIVTTIAYLILSIWFTQKLNSTFNDVVDNTSNRWDKLGLKFKEQLQTWLNCCGYDNPQDRPVTPCPITMTGGCSARLKSSMESLVRLLMIATYSNIGVFILLIGVILLISFVRFKARPVERANGI